MTVTNTILLMPTMTQGSSRTINYILIKCYASTTPLMMFIEPKIPSILRPRIVSSWLAACDAQQSQHSHTFWYAQVLGIFHAWVVHSGPRSNSLAPQKFNFLWIHWLGLEPGHRSGWKTLHLDRVGFVGDEQDSPSFGF
jgi:hypothetical protein